MFNSIPWRVCEGRLVTWGTPNCAEVRGATNVRLFIVVGAIPLTVSSKWRYFGKGEFGDNQDIVNYRVNVPTDLWTCGLVAACCTYYDQGTLEYCSTAFWREKNPGNAQCHREDVGSLGRLLSGRIRGRTRLSFNLFPQTPQ